MDGRPCSLVCWCNMRCRLASFCIHTRAGVLLHSHSSLVCVLYAQPVQRYSVFTHTRACYTLIPNSVTLCSHSYSTRSVRSALLCIHTRWRVTRSVRSAVLCIHTPGVLHAQFDQRYSVFTHAGVLHAQSKQRYSVFTHTGVLHAQSDQRYSVFTHTGVLHARSDQRYSVFIHTHGHATRTFRTALHCVHTPTVHARSDQRYCAFTHAGVLHAQSDQR